MRPRILLGTYYAVAIAGLVLAEDWKVSTQSADLVSEASSYAETLATLHAGDTVNVTGKADGDFLPATVGGKSGWIARANLYTPEEYKETLGKAGSDSAAKGQEGAYAKGFDPEVEKRAAQDDATLKRFLDEEVKPMIWDVRGSRPLEEKEEEIETFVLQHPLVARGEHEKENDAALQAQWKQLNDEAKVLREKNEPFRAKWQADLRAFRQAGQIGEFAGRK